MMINFETSGAILMEWKSIDFVRVRFDLIRTLYTEDAVLSRFHTAMRLLAIRGQQLVFLPFFGNIEPEKSRVLSCPQYNIRDWKYFQMRL